MSQHQPNRDAHPLLIGHLQDAQAKWDRLSTSDLAQIRTKAELIARVEERYMLPHEVAADDVEIWGFDRRF